MAIKQKLSDKAFTVGVSVILFFVVIVTLYPFLHVIALSFSSPSAVIAGRVSFYPVDPRLSAYRYVLKDPMLFNGLMMSVFYVVSGVLVLLTLVSITAYPLSVREFYGKNVITFFLAFTMVFSGGMIPTYLVVRGLGLLNKIWAIILPSAMSAFYVIVFRTFFSQIPDSMRESAFLDGANDLVILLRVILPLSKPVIATVALFHAVFHWNSFFPALLYLQRESLHPVQMVLRRVLVSPAHMDTLLARGEEIFVLPENISAAYITVVSFPIIVVYPFAQKYFTKGMMLGAVKG